MGKTAFLSVLFIILIAKEQGESGKTWPFFFILKQIHVERSTVAASTEPGAKES